ncbi:hypothetical protein COOONC_22801 [Cooperia oncophora]
MVESMVFSYPSRPNFHVANGITFKARRGESVALVGPSGSGKSTIINLLQRFYDTEKGSISVDGRNIVEINTQHLRNNVALVGQEPVLFRGMIGHGCI